MKTLLISVSIILILGCKGSGDVVVGTDGITKIDLNNKNTTIHFSASDKDTPYTIVINATPKEDEFQDMKIKLNFESEAKEASSNAMSSPLVATNQTASVATPSSNSGTTSRGTRYFKIPHDDAQEHQAKPIGENDKFILYKDERLAQDFNPKDYLDALVNIESRMRFFAGNISDLDNNGRVMFVFTLFPKESLKGAFQNDDIKERKEEVLYIAGNESTPTMISAMTHELQHLINFNYKYTFPGKDGKKTDEKTSEHYGINEGLSHLLQDLCGYSGTLDTIVTAYLQQNPTTSLKTEFSSDADSPDEEAKVRGGNYLFLRYLYEQLGENSFTDSGTIEPSKGGEFIRNLIQSTEVGYDKIGKLYGKPIGDLMLDWGITISGKATKKTEYKYNGYKDDKITKNKRGIDLKQAAIASPLKKEEELKVPHYGIVIFTVTVPKRFANEMSMQVNIQRPKGNFKMAFIPQL